jgi:hypothetical protein
VANASDLPTVDPQLVAELRLLGEQVRKRSIVGTLDVGYSLASVALTQPAPAAASAAASAPVAAPLGVGEVQRISLR